jgi:hypothetical protein
MRMQMKSQKEAKHLHPKVSDLSEPFVPERRRSEASHELELQESSLDVEGNDPPLDLNSIEQQLKNMFNF